MTPCRSSSQLVSVGCLRRSTVAFPHQEEAVSTLLRPAARAIQPSCGTPRTKPDRMIGRIPREGAPVVPEWTAGCDSLAVPDRTSGRRRRPPRAGIVGDALSNISGEEAPWSPAAKRGRSRTVPSPGASGRSRILGGERATRPNSPAPSRRRLAGRRWPLCLRSPRMFSCRLRQFDLWRPVRPGARAWFEPPNSLMALRCLHRGRFQVADDGHLDRCHLS